MSYNIIIIHECIRIATKEPLNLIIIHYGSLHTVAHTCVDTASYLYVRMCMQSAYLTT